MQGPMAAAIRSAGRRGRAWRRRSPPARRRRAPRQPAWAAPTTPASGSAEQHRRAIGGDDAEGEPGPVGDHRIGARALRRAARARSTMHHLGAVHLRQADQRCGSAPRARAARARFSSTASRVIAAGQAAIEAGVGAGGDAAAAGEEAVRRGQALAEQAQRCRSSCGLWRIPAGGGQAGWQSASALNSRPMRRARPGGGAASIRRARPRAAAGRAPARSVRWNRPSRARNSPCGTGPCTAAPARARRWPRGRRNRHGR